MASSSSHIESSILKAIHHCDVSRLRYLGQNFGFLSLDVRKQAWPILLHCCNQAPAGGPPHSLSSTTTTYENQIKLDVNRSFVHFKTHPLISACSPTTTSPFDFSSSQNIQQYPSPHLAYRKTQLYRILIHLSTKFPFLHYYQGLHDIATVLLLVLGEDVATVAIENLALFFVRDAMHTNIEPVMQLMRIILPIIKSEDKEIYRILEQCELHPYFCLSWFISWFSHDLASFDSICRFFDLFLSSNPIMPIYAASAIVLSRKADLMDIDHEYPMVHSFLSKVPHDMDVDVWIHEALRLYQRYPLTTIQGITGWSFDVNCAAVRFDVDFPCSPDEPRPSPDQVEVLMESGAEHVPPNHPESSGIYTFKPLPLVKRMGRSYIRIEGDASTLLLFTAMAIGVLSISVGMVTHRDGAEAMGNMDVLARFIVMLIQRGQ